MSESQEDSEEESGSKPKKKKGFDYKKWYKKKGSELNRKRRKQYAESSKKRKEHHKRCQDYHREKREERLTSQPDPTPEELGFKKLSDIKCHRRQMKVRGRIQEVVLRSAVTKCLGISQPTGDKWAAAGVYIPCWTDTNDRDWYTERFIEFLKEMVIEHKRRYFKVGAFAEKVKQEWRRAKK